MKISCARAWFVAAFCAVHTLTFAQSIHPMYDDQLVNGWQNWSWAAVNFANTSPAIGTKSISVAMDGWEALSLQRGAVNSKIFKSVRFSVHGGATGGQRFWVTGCLSNVAQSSFSIGPIAANTWTTYEVPLASLGVANKTNFTGFYFQNSTANTQPTFYFDDIKLVPIDPPSTAQATVSLAQPQATIDSRLFGINTAIWDSNLGSANSINLMNQADLQALRYPGGSASDEYNWQTNTSGSNTWQWASGFSTFRNVVAQTGADPVITVNYGTGTPTLAAAWVQEANITRQMGIKYWEVGNECYGTWEADNNTRPHDPITYANRFAQYYTAMKAIDPTIRLGCPITYSETDFANYSDLSVTNPRTGVATKGWSPLMLNRLNQLGIRPDYVTYHMYPYYVGDENDDILLQLYPIMKSSTSAVRQMLTDYLGTSSSSIEIHCNELNSNAGAQGKQSVSIVNSLFLADLTGTSSQTELRNLMWWDWANGKDYSGNNASYLYGWRNYGDLGVYGSATDMYPAYYVIKLLKYWARGGEQSYESSVDSPFVSVYPVRRPDGSVHVLAISKRTVSSQNLVLTFSGFTPAAQFTQYRYGIPQDEAARTGVGNKDIDTTTGSNGSATMPVILPPYSVTVYQFKSLRQVSGTLNLAGITGWTPGTATFEFRPANQSNVVWSVQAPVAPDGSFALNGPVSGNYDVTVKVTHWLRKTTNVNLTAGSVSGLVLNCANGDVDGDNSVTIFDYVDLSAAFDSSIGSPNWNAMADLDEDGAVTIFDYVILSEFFDQGGDD
ncbi:MAG: alpha-L-arabinofuranosidase [Armatimonadetes bacterium]|nr:alpha-L-arabinofuranosidase [Armatimonadota bacterium]